MKLEHVVPWGRTIEEYQQMFNLGEEDKHKKILGCGDGPASFNAELTQMGGKIISIDPIYQFSKQQISDRIEQVRPIIMEQIIQNKGAYLWNQFDSPLQLEQTRLSAMNHFLADYDKGKAEQRYIHGSLPKLNFADKEFDLALCSHFLFLYEEHFSLQDHIQSITELVRVSKEVRIYPLLSLEGTQSNYLTSVIEHFERLGTKVGLEEVSYQFQKGATKMLVILANE